MLNCRIVTINKYPFNIANRETRFTYKMINIAVNEVNPSTHWHDGLPTPLYPRRHNDRDFAMEFISFTSEKLKPRKNATKLLFLEVEPRTHTDLSTTSASKCVEIDYLVKERQFICNFPQYNIRRLNIFSAGRAKSLLLLLFITTSSVRNYLGQ